MALEDTLETPLAKAVRKAGGQTAYGLLVGRKQSTIHHALKHGRKIDLEHVPTLERELGIPRWELRPDYFQAPAGQEPARQSVEQPPKPASCSQSGQDLGGPSSPSDDGIAA